MFDNPFSMVVAIVAICAIARVLRTRYTARHSGGDALAPYDDPDTNRMREEIRALKDRVAVLERILTENNRGVMLDREIEALRSRD